MYSAVAQSKDSSPFEGFGGFVEVDEAPLEDGAYPLKRNLSIAANLSSAEALALQQRQIEQLELSVCDLKVEVERLKQLVVEFESENQEWSTRYSRRVSFMANLGLGTWSLFFHFFFTCAFIAYLPVDGHLPQGFFLH